MLSIKERFLIKIARSNVINAGSQYKTFAQVKKAKKGLSAIKLMDGTTPKFFVVNFSNKLGEGGNAVVFSGKDENGNEVALRFERDNSSSLSEEKKQQFNDIRKNEIEILKQIGMYKADGSLGNMFCQAQDKIKGGELKDYIDVVDLSPDERWMLALKIAYQLKWLHNFMPDKNILHNDLKSRNIMFHRYSLPDNVERLSTFDITLIDFGYSKKVEKDQSYTDDRSLGSPDYMAPEIAEFEEKNGEILTDDSGSPIRKPSDKLSEYSVRSDYYALGKLFVEIGLGEEKLTQSLLNRDPSKRPSIDEVIATATKELAGLDNVDPYVLDLIKISQRDNNKKTLTNGATAAVQKQITLLKEIVKDNKDAIAILNSVDLTYDQKLIAIRGHPSLSFDNETTEKVHSIVDNLSGTARFLGSEGCLKFYIAYTIFEKIKHPIRDVELSAKFDGMENRKLLNTLVSIVDWMNVENKEFLSKLNLLECNDKQKIREIIRSFDNMKTPEQREEWLKEMKNIVSPTPGPSAG